MFDPSLLLLLLFCFVPFQNGAEATSGKESCSTAWKIRLVVEITGSRFAESSEFGTDEVHGRCILLILICIFVVFCFNDLFSTNQSISWFRYIECRWLKAFSCRNRFLTALGVVGNRPFSHQGFATTWVQWKMPPMRSRPQVFDQSSGEGTRRTGQPSSCVAVFWWRKDHWVEQKIQR